MPLAKAFGNQGDARPQSAAQCLDIAGELAALGLGVTGPAQGLRPRAAVAVQAGLRNSELEGLAPP